MRDLLVLRRNDRERCPPYLKHWAALFISCALRIDFTGGTSNPQAGASPVDG